jgi:hypothetical protein
LQYGVPFDYDENDLKEGNDVEIIVVDRDTTDGDGDPDGFGNRIVYKGYISLIERSVSGTTESVTVHLLGYYTLLALDVLKNGAQTTLYSHNTTGLTTTAGSIGAADIGLMMRTVIDRYRAETTSPKIFYIGTHDIPNTGTTATYAFEQKTYREAMQKLKEMAPADVYWYVNELGRLTFKTKPTTSTHKFIFGKHFSNVRVETSLEKVRNFALIWDGDSGGDYKDYSDAASITKYGRRVERINAFGTENANVLDAIGAKFLAENKDPAIRIFCTIIDNNGDSAKGYDIENIQPGDTCSFLGFSSALADIFRENMLITRVAYFLDRVELEVEIVKSGIVELQQTQRQAIADIGSGGLGIPVSYT